MNRQSFIVCLIVALIIGLWQYAQTATLTRGYTFGSTEQVTNTKLHNLVDNATITGITGTDFADGSITEAKIANNAVTADKISNGSVTTNKIADNSILFKHFTAACVSNSVLASNSITGDKLNTNFTLPAGVVVNLTNATWITGSVPGDAVVGVTNSAGAADSNKVVKLGDDGLISSSMLGNASGVSIIRVPLTFFTGSGSAFTWSVVTNITTTATTGGVTVVGRAMSSTVDSVHWLRVRDADTNYVSTVYCETSAGGYGFPQMHTTLIDFLTGTAKTYYMEVAASGASATYTNAVAAGSDSPANSGGFGFDILQTP